MPAERQDAAIASATRASVQRVRCASGSAAARYMRQYARLCRSVGALGFLRPRENGCLRCCVDIQMRGAMLRCHMPCC